MYDEEHQTDEIIMDALTKIAREDETDLEKLWQDGYTETHSSEEVEELVKLHILKNVKTEDLEEYYNWGCCEKVWIIEKEDSRISIEDEDTEVVIIADDVNDMNPYIKKLFRWATTAWDYDAVDNWNTDEYQLLTTDEGYLKVHLLGKDDKHGLFLGKYADSPELLKDYEDREIHVNVYMKISEEEFKELSESEEEE